MKAPGHNLNLPEKWLIVFKAGSKKGVCSLSVIVEGHHVFFSIPLIITHTPVECLYGLGF